MATFRLHQHIGLPDAKVGDRHWNLTGSLRVDTIKVGDGERAPRFALDFDQGKTGDQP